MWSQFSINKRDKVPLFGQVETSIERFKVGGSNISFWPLAIRANLTSQRQMARPATILITWSTRNFAEQVEREKKPWAILSSSAVTVGCFGYILYRGKPVKIKKKKAKEEKNQNLKQRIYKRVPEKFLNQPRGASKKPFFCFLYFREVGRACACLRDFTYKYACLSAFMYSFTSCIECYSYNVTKANLLHGWVIVD